MLSAKRRMTEEQKELNKINNDLEDETTTVGQYQALCKKAADKHDAYAKKRAKELTASSDRQIFAS